MKRIMVVLLGLLLTLVLTACGNPQSPHAILSAKIVSIDGTSILLANMDENANPADIYWIGVKKVPLFGTEGKSINANDLQSGMVIDVHFNGMVLESFPAQLGKVDAIYVKEQQDDLVGFYLNVIDDLYHTDEGLNTDISVIAFNLQEVNNLTATEQTALVYLAGNEYNVQSLQSTYAELDEQGYIDKDKKAFKDGILITIEDTPIHEDSFTFSAGKWRAPLGAYTFYDCTAEKKDGVWTYTIGAHIAA